MTHAWKRYRDVDCGCTGHACQGGFRGPLVGGRERAGAHAGWAGASLTYSYRGRDGQMEEKVIRRNEGWSKRRGDKNAQDILSSCTQTR